MRYCKYVSQTVWNRSKNGSDIPTGAMTVACLPVLNKAITPQGYNCQRVLI